jgi:lipopolysaccharide export system permease protein
MKDYVLKIVSIIGPDRKIDPSINPAKLRQFVFIRTQQRIESNKRTIMDKIAQLENNDKEIDSYMVEVHKKYSLPFACIVFVLIGAPLGTMTRKGGFGMAAGISMSFFLIYWSFLIGGEKLADRNLISPFLGIWGANIFLGIIGIILMVKSARETITLDFNFLVKLIPRSWKSQPENNENN